jgi:hypothetical protein
MADVEMQDASGTAIAKDKTSKTSKAGAEGAEGKKRFEVKKVSLGLLIGLNMTTDRF